MCCDNPARPGSPSLLGMQHSIARQKFRTKFHKCQREWRESERERELLADCGINFHATNYGNKTVFSCGTCPVRV